jgi:predicted nucleic acid-binding protein
MKVFPDTSFLCALYRKQVNSPQAAAYFQRMAGSLPVSSLLLFEFRQSTRLQVWLHAQDRHKGFAKTEADKMLAALQNDIAHGDLLVTSPDWADVHVIADQLSAKHTANGGYRGLDVLHVATALHLGVREFLSFDSKQRALALAEGLRLSP